MWASSTERDTRDAQALRAGGAASRAAPGMTCWRHFWVRLVCKDCRGMVPRSGRPMLAQPGSACAWARLTRPKSQVGRQRWADCHGRGDIPRRCGVVEGRLRKAYIGARGSRSQGHHPRRCACQRGGRARLHGERCVARAVRGVYSVLIEACAGWGGGRGGAMVRATLAAEWRRTERGAGVPPAHALQGGLAALAHPTYTTDA